MGIDSALVSALTGLAANKETLSVISQNIANVNNPNYSRRVVELTSLIDPTGAGIGVAIEGVQRNVDDQLLAEMRNQQSTLGYASIIKDYYQQIQLLIGTPGANDDICTALNDFFSSIKSLSTNPELSSLRSNAVYKGENIANLFASASRGLQQLRYNADQNIKSDVDIINSHIQTLHDINISLASAPINSAASANLQEQRDISLRTIANLLDINTYYNKNGSVNVSTAGGRSLLDDNLYELRYDAATSIDAFITNNVMNNLTTSVVDNNSNLIGTLDLISRGVGENAGTNSTVLNRISSGELLGLQQLRDVLLPGMIDELDLLANQIRIQVNSVHNSGSGFPPSTIFTGTRPLLASDYRQWEGSVRIGVIDMNGNPITRKDGSGINPLVINLENLQDSNGTGLPSVQTIMNEINQYYYTDIISNRASLGNLDDIKMSATSNFSVVPNGTVFMDFELDNSSQIASTFQVIAVSVNNGAAGLVGGLPIPYTIQPGNMERTGLPLELNFAGGGGAPYNVAVTIQVTDADGNVSTGVLNFGVNDNPGTTQVQNTRYAVSSVTGSAILTPPNTSQGVLTANLVDSNGNVVTPGNAGFLQLKTLNSNYGISIDQLGSSEKGAPATFNPYTPAIAPTNLGFGAYFELNDFFVRNPNQVPGSSNAEIYGSALNMAVRADIVSNCNNISLGKLGLSPNNLTTKTIGLAPAIGTIDLAGGIPHAGDTITLAGQTFTFSNAAVGNNQIQIGATIPITLTNMAATFNSVNAFTSGTVNNAIFVSNGLNALDITASASGTAGNLYSMAGNLSVAVSFNGNPVSFTPSAKLVGGLDQVVSTSVQPWTYEIGSGSNQVVLDIANLANQSLTFTAAGGIGAVTTTLTAYAAGIITYNSIAANNSEDYLTQQQSYYDGLYQQYDAGSGVNLDEELANMLECQSAYSANARVVSTVFDLFQILLKSFDR